MGTYILGGARTDFARNWTKEGLGLVDMFAEVVPQALADAGVDVKDVDVVHVANLAAELFSGQAQLGGLVAAAVPGLEGLPSARHEAACASGSVAVLAADADLLSGRYDVAVVVGVELMRNVSAQRGAEFLGSAAWAGREAVGAEFPWPSLFAEVADVYVNRYGKLDSLGAFAEQAYTKAKSNPFAQTRDWDFPEGSFTADDTVNPLVAGRLRKTDCGRITDGAAAVVLVSPRYAKKRGLDTANLPVFQGFGHRTATMLLADKLKAPGPYLFPHLRGAITDAYERAGISGPEELDVVEMHDCFTVTGVVAAEHLGLAKPGEFTAVPESPVINPGGGLLGDGHPVGATGVRMVLDAARHARAGKRTMTLNIGGSFTTVVATVVGTDA